MSGAPVAAERLDYRKLSQVAAMAIGPARQSGKCRVRETNTTRHESASCGEAITLMHVKVVAAFERLIKNRAYAA